MSSLRTRGTHTKETKSGINADSARQKRIGQFTQIRNKEREEVLEKRRRRHNDQTPEAQQASGGQGQANGVPQQILDDEEISKDLPQLPTLVQNLESPDMNILKDSAFRLRQLVSIVNGPPFDEVIQLGGLPRLVRLLEHPDTGIAFEAAWCLTNIASGKSHHTKAVVDAGAIPQLVELLGSEDSLLRDQAVWALGNIAGESPQYRDIILDLGGMTKLIAVAHRVQFLCMLRNVSWTLSNFCRGRNPQPNFDLVSAALPTLHNMLNFRDDDIIADAAWSLSFLSDDTGLSNLPENHKIEMVLHSGVLGRLIILLSHSNPNIKTPALRTIGNIVTGSNFQTQIVLNANVLPPLISLLSNSRKGIRREAAWTLSNIAAGAKPQVQALVEANAFHALFLCASQADTPIKREICWAICNAASNGDPGLLAHISSLGWIGLLLNFLTIDDDDLTICALDTLHHFLEFGEKNKVPQTTEAGTILYCNIYAQIVERSGADHIFPKLLGSENELVYHKAVNIMKLFLGYIPVPEGEAHDETAFNDTDGGLVDFSYQGQNQQEAFDI